MKVLVVGASGFIGRNVAETLAAGNHEVVSAFRGADGQNGQPIDLLDPASIARVLTDVQPEAIISCAGVVNNDESAAQNATFTNNLLSQVVATGLHPRRIIISGSAGEYGSVAHLPVTEDTPLNATSPYGVSKVKEEEVAHRFQREAGLDIVVARVFNPIGPGMPERMLLPRVLSRIAEIRQGRQKTIETNRLDAIRDLVDVRDVAAAYACLVAAPELKFDAYNVGSGVSTSNGELIGWAVQYSHLSPAPEIVQTAPNPEQGVASQADVSRLRELGWAPMHAIQQVVEETVDVTNQG